MFALLYCRFGGQVSPGTWLPAPVFSSVRRLRVDSKMVTGGLVWFALCASGRLKGVPDYVCAMTTGIISSFNSSERLTPRVKTPPG